LAPPQPPNSGRFVDVSALNRDTSTKRRKVAKQAAKGAATKSATSSPSLSPCKSSDSADKASTSEPASASKSRGKSVSASSSSSSSMGRWCDEEHALFLKGLEKFGSHNWRGVASVVKTRTIVQVRTHAQKYFQKIGKASLSSISSGARSDDDDDGSVASTNCSRRTGMVTPPEVVVYTNGIKLPMSPSLVAVRTKRQSASPRTNNKAVNTSAVLADTIARSALARLASVALCELSR
jgi:SHAQKYF class myb-like DNA-binding protein